MTNSSFTFQQSDRFVLITSPSCVRMQSTIRTRPGPARSGCLMPFRSIAAPSATTPPSTISAVFRPVENNVVLTTVWIDTKTKPFRLPVSEMGGPAVVCVVWCGVFGQREMMSRNIGFCVHQTVMKQTKGRPNLFGSSVVVCKTETGGVEEETRVAQHQPTG